MISRPASESGQRRSRTRRRGEVGSGGADRLGRSRLHRQRGRRLQRREGPHVSRSTPRPARSCGSSSSCRRPRAIRPRTAWRDRRSMHRLGRIAARRADQRWRDLDFLHLDPKTGLLYVPGGNPAPDFAIGVREGDNLFTGSVVVLDAKTGAYKTISRSCRKTGTTGTSPTHPSDSNRGRQEARWRSRRRTATSTASISRPMPALSA